MKYIKPMLILVAIFSVLTVSVVTRTNLRSDSNLSVAFGGDDGPIVEVTPFGLVMPESIV